MTARTQRESMLLGAIAGGAVSFVLVLVLSLVPWSTHDQKNSVEGQPVAGLSAQETIPPNLGNQGVPGRGNGQGRGGSGSGQGAGINPLKFGSAGEEVLDAFAAGGCVACHSIKGVGGEAATVGPHLFRIGAIAADRRPGTSVQAYVEESIINPDAFIMPNCPTGPCSAGLMPQTYAATLSATDLTTIVEYLSKLGTGEESMVLSP